MTNTNLPHIWDLIIIGSGISGLSAARAITQKGHSCLVLDKGRRIGGRCSTKRKQGVCFNHGAQFFTCKDAAFTAVTKSAQAQGAVHSWSFGHHAPAFAGAPTMRDFPQFLAADLPCQIEQEVEIKQIERHHDTSLYHLTDTKDESYHSKAILITAPAPQAAHLVAPLDNSLAETADSASYEPCWTVMLALDEPLQEPVMPVREAGIIGWANYEPSRDPKSYQPAVTIQATPAASREMLSWEKQTVIARLQEALEAQYKRAFAVQFSLAHRWLYARVAQSADATRPFISDDQSLALAGDYFGSARLESAFLSGRRAAKALLDGRCLLG